MRFKVGKLIRDRLPAIMRAQGLAVFERRLEEDEFRAALRDAIEQVKDVAGAHGIFNMSPQDHLGLDQRGVVMVKIENGKWVYQPSK